MERKGLAIHGCGEAKDDTAQSRGHYGTAPRPGVCCRKPCTFPGLVYVVGRSRSSRSSDMRIRVEQKGFLWQGDVWRGPRGPGESATLPACLPRKHGCILVCRLRTGGQFTEKVLVFGRRRRSMSGSGVVESKCQTGNRGQPSSGAVGE